jgi:hypothetical protein
MIIESKHKLHQDDRDRDKRERIRLEEVGHERSAMRENVGL